MMVPLAGLVDTAFLGHLGDLRHLAGVILASILFDYLYRVLKFLRSSTNALTAQAVGCHDDRAMVLAVLRSGLVALAIGLVLVLVQYPIQRLGFALLSGSTEVEIAGLDYFYTRIWGAPAVLLNFVLLGWFLGREKNGIVFLLAIISNGSNVLLDYLMIGQWGWASSGAGLATATSQYLSLFTALGFAVATVPWQEVKAALPELADWAALKDTVALKGNLLVRFLGLISAYAVFLNFSSALGTTVLAQNGLLLQIALLSQFTIQGVGMTSQTLTGNFKGKGETERMLPLLVVAIATTLPMALGFAGVTLLFPEAVFGLLTNHGEISETITTYTLWLLPLLEITAVTFMLEGFYIGTKRSEALRNGVLVAFSVGFLPLALAGRWASNNHLLWCALVGYMATLALGLAWQLPRHLAEFQRVSPASQASNLSPGES